ncbi:mediator complex subunit [Mycoblastus sanguinarius]|nr:mediator complex subunit [Mycoblastus sanguinarius]
MDSQIAIPGWPQSLDMLHDVGLGALSFQDNVLDTPPVPTRAGLYVYLNSMLQDTPSFDDNAVIDFLNARYKEDISSLAGDLILAAFDVLANAMYRNESTSSINILRSFLVNKLPVFIQVNYAGMIFQPLTTEHCIRQALVRVDPAAFPSFSQMFDPLGRNSLLSEARQEFLFACALHYLIPERSIEEILGDVPMQSLPASGRYHKDDLVSQCTTNPAKIEEYIGELENMEGNAGEIAGAIIEILHTLCSNNDTMTLKAVCNALCRKPTVLDVIMLFTSPRSLLQPLCHTLDNWQDHEDQGEYQPVYDEFGSILLFIVVIQHRFKLQPFEMGVESPDSFIVKYFRVSTISRSLDDLTEHENELLGGWIRGLFETESISDELMSLCKPKEFHVLVATLFDQSLKACQANVLALETLRGGFEYLLEPFLLPSLIAGLTWFSHCLWEINNESTNIDTILPALQALLKPPSMPHDSSAIHSAVLSVVSKPLADSLSHVQRQYASRPDISPLLGVLNPYSNERQGTTALSELASWSTTPGGGLLVALRQTIQSLILWSATTASSADMSPPSYTHHQLLGTLRVLGAKAVLLLLIDEVTGHPDGSSDADIALDIIVLLIFTAPNPSPQSPSIKRQLSLREVLQSELQNVEDLAKTDPIRASTVVRLQRRVEALLIPKTIPSGGTSGFMAGVVRNDGGMTTADIDDVLGEAENQIAEAQNFLNGENATLLSSLA